MLYHDYLQGKGKKKSGKAKSTAKAAAPEPSTPADKLKAEGLFISENVCVVRSFQYPLCVVVKRQCPIWSR
jgi:hypothetical protein